MNAVSSCFGSYCCGFFIDGQYSDIGIWTTSPWSCLFPGFFISAAEEARTVAHKGTWTRALPLSYPSPDISAAHSKPFCSFVTAKVILKIYPQCVYTLSIGSPSSKESVASAHPGKTGLALYVCSKHMLISEHCLIRREPPRSYGNGFSLWKLSKIWRDGPEFKSIECFFRGPGLHSQHPCGK